MLLVFIQKMNMKMIIPGLLGIAAIVIFAFMPIEKASTAPGNGPDNEKGIQFIEADWNKALQEAKKHNKLIFLDAYASWCGPCKLLKKKTFPDKSAGDFFNRNFINVAIDMEKGDGPALSGKFRISAYPTLIIADAEGNVVTYTQGYLKPGQLIEFGKHGLKQRGK
jgi:thioredoxin-related protein